MFTIDREKPITKLDHPAEYWLNEVVKFLDWIDCDFTLFQDATIFNNLRDDQYFSFDFIIKPLALFPTDFSGIINLLRAKFSDNISFKLHNNAIFCEYFYNPDLYNEQY